MSSFCRICVSIPQAIQCRFAHSFILICSKSKHENWVKIRDRTSKRFWERVKHPMSHQTVLSDKEAKEEKQYLEAMDKENTFDAELQALSRDIKGLQDSVSRVLKYKM